MAVPDRRADQGSPVIYEPSPLAVGLFLAFVGFTLALSFWLGRKTR
jgi:hypothetical protein